MTRDYQAISTFCLFSASLLNTAQLAVGQSGAPPGGFPLPTVNGSAQLGGVTVVPSGSLYVVRQTAILFEELVLNDQSSVVVAPGIQEVQITCNRLVLHGHSTFDLSPGEDLALASTTTLLDKPPKQPQAAPRLSQEPYQRPGAVGSTGATGKRGLSGVNLKLNVLNLDARNGSLWIQTDGGLGKQGGQGGDGGKGSSGPHDGITNADGGDGGNGGRGGTGGKGGNTAKVILSMQGSTISPSRAPGVAPSSRPVEAKSPGLIVIYGSPGAGGRGGPGGNGGAGGEGHKGQGFSSDSKTGRHGNDGGVGVDGSPGEFTP